MMNEADKRKQIATQIEQLTYFIDSTYAGMVHDLKLTWRLAGGPDAIGRAVEQVTADYWRDKHGKHEEVTMGAGDAYYGSATLSHMLYEAAYHMRERLVDQLSGIKGEKTRSELEREARTAAEKKRDMDTIAQLQAKHAKTAAT